MNGSGQVTGNTETESIEAIMEQVGQRARAAARVLANTPTEQKNKALSAAAAALLDKADEIVSKNAVDMDGGREKGLTNALMDRLEITPSRIESMSNGLKAIVELKDPIGETIAAWDQPNGLKIERVRTPLGVIGVIYESRPNVTADAAALCLKCGNACILRGGSESFHSSRAILSCLHNGLEAAGLSVECVQMVPTTDRAAVGKMLKMTETIDVIVPRGGQSLTERVLRESQVPTFQHLVGLCHTYIHKDANPDMAREISFNAKMRRTGICGATETLLVDKSVANTILPNIIDDFVDAGCEVRGDETVASLNKVVIEAQNEDWDTEYLDSIVSIKTVASLNEAVAHINDHGSEHTDAIITEDAAAAEQFMNGISSAIVMHNASTQFADGGEFGMGAEIGIATGKMHARGPVGVEQLTTFKYKVRGNGAVRP